MPIRQYQVSGRKAPTEKEPNPPIYRMKLFAPNEVLAKSRFWYFLHQVKKMKKTTGEILDVNELREKNTRIVKNYGVWIRYNSRSGTHNMYKEYRDVTLCGAVQQMYSELAGRHRARPRSIQIMRTAMLAAKDTKKPNIKQFHDSKIKFPLTHRIPRPHMKKFPSKCILRLWKPLKPLSLARQINLGIWVSNRYMRSFQHALTLPDRKTTESQPSSYSTILGFRRLFFVLIEESEMDIEKERLHDVKPFIDHYSAAAQGSADSDLQGCNLTDISAIEWPECLEELYVARGLLWAFIHLYASSHLENNFLSDIPSHSLKNTKLQKIWIEHNHLSTLDPLAAIPTLRAIYARNNSIQVLTKLPPSLCVLDVSENELHLIADTLPALRSLNVSNNVDCVEKCPLSRSPCEIDVRGTALESTLRHNPASRYLRLTLSARRLSAIQSPWIPIIAGSSTLCLLCILLLVMCCRHKRYSHYRARSSTGNETDTDSDQIHLSIQRRKNIAEELVILSRRYSIHNAFHRIEFRNEDIAKTRFRSWQSIRVLSSRERYRIVVAEMGKRQQKRLIVVKQVMTRYKGDYELLRAFVREIELTFNLVHPNLVPFFGVTWECYSNLAYACEYMPHGSLAKQLTRIVQSRSQAAFQWFPSPSSENYTTSPNPDLRVRSKLEYVVEILEALLFLNSIPSSTPLRQDNSNQTLYSGTPYQDLNSHAVLLDEEFTICLSIFGIHKRMTLEEMLGTAGGATSWIAPEVLKCNPCNEKANVYSLGIIMTELDTCQPPYQSGIGEFLPSKPSNARIAMMVGANLVQPHLDPECPSDIRSLIKSCIEYEPEDRPALRDLYTVAVGLLQRGPSNIDKAGWKRSVDLPYENGRDNM
uniref:60S ribosomal protein L18a putative n=1 Tax=Albugo laibachii Nc14 TaxID=890382 RepID=F0WM08_9STRA|nr:60S ribosomal protein L18a putative [Albugo laibachii Nc14]|eukprot:CCA22335.1 60S ribosomal protein L18a putative [Albugo laibachii Nc14]